MLPERCLPLRVIGQQAFIDFLGPQDEPWLRVLVGELQRFEGRRWRELTERLAEPLPCACPPFKRQSATRVLARMWHRDRVAAVSPKEARARLFMNAAATSAARSEVMAQTAAALGVTTEELQSSLFADLPPEHRVRAPEPQPGVPEICLRTNLAIAQATLMRASRIDLEVSGLARPVVRLAKLHGLLCSVREEAEGGPPTLEISGPFSLFRHTLLYGRALAALLPQLVWCARFRLRASTRLWGRVVDLELNNDAPIFPPTAPPQFDSRLEERLARDFARLAPDWDLVREPEPLRAEGTLIFPDFLAQHRIHTDRRVFIEIVGFWTADYVRNKVTRLRASGVRNLVLCLDEDRACGATELDEAWPVVKFRRRIDAAEVMRAVEEVTSP